ncbi:MAG: hypothetical protein U5L11_10905 [Arhodomonas sp.]|nr:hypothetical protein [Arhodomonas sp.]
MSLFILFYHLKKKLPAFGQRGLADEDEELRCSGVPCQCCAPAIGHMTDALKIGKEPV